MHGVNRLDWTRKWDNEVIEAGKRDGERSFFFLPFFFEWATTQKEHVHREYFSDSFVAAAPRVYRNPWTTSVRGTLPFPAVVIVRHGWWKGRVDYVGLVNTTNHFYKIQGVVENDILVAGALVEPWRMALRLNEGKCNSQCDSWRGGWWWEVVGWWVEVYYCTYNWWVLSVDGWKLVDGQYVKYSKLF